MITPDFVAHNGENDVHGLDGWFRFVNENHEQFGPVETGVDEVLDDGGLVAERWWFKAGTGDGPHLSGHGITVHRIENGKLAENWAIFQPDE
ncbi:MAG: hypothetical protein QOC59_1179 [Microbacteriaceae bacterium]|nr:hypothetical protein [Microbacteriaceae bacterium]